MTISVMSEQTYKTIWNAEKAPPMQPAKVHVHRLHYSYCGRGKWYDEPQQPDQTTTLVDC